jgi:GntR family transcriptional regulator, transcriptional repressor for pyruvate dehydrogenase complex
MAPRTSKSASLEIPKIERADRLSSQVSVHLENLIVQNQLAPGGRLPTERDLATRFNVSRTVIREAVSGLVAKGMLEVNAGSGTIIRRPTAKHVSQTMSLFLTGGEHQLRSENITEVRRLLEVEIAGLAAERRTAEDLAALRNILDEFPHVAGSKEAFVRWDMTFHVRLAAATHNQLLVLLLDSMSGVMARVRELGYEVPNTHEQALAYHQNIFTQVELASRDGARQAMREHIDNSEQVMNAGLSLSTQLVAPTAT